MRNASPFTLCRLVIYKSQKSIESHIPSDVLFVRCIDAHTVRTSRPKRKRMALSLAFSSSDSYTTWIKEFKNSKVTRSSLGIYRRRQSRRGPIIPNVSIWKRFVTNSPERGYKHGFCFPFEMIHQGNKDIRARIPRPKIDKFKQTQSI